MATEPANTSENYNPLYDFIPAVGRLPILGKVRAEVDKLRASAANDLNQVSVRNSAQTKSEAKIDAEISLLEQKTATELGQTSDIIPSTIGIDSISGDRTLWDDSAVAPDPVGIIGQQRALLAKQRDGYDRDAEQKLTKIMADIWSVQQTSGETMTPADAGFSDQDIQDVVDKARDGLGLAAT